jgi:hypothetical protein
MRHRIVAGLNSIVLAACSGFQEDTFVGLVGMPFSRTEMRLHGHDTT